MQLSIRGNDLALSKREIRYATKFFSHNLLGKRITNNLYVEIIYKEMRLGINNAEAAWGFCFPTDFDSKNLRSFELTLSPGTYKTISLKVIAHEMTHLYQFARGHLRYCDDVMFYKWHGKKISHNCRTEEQNKLPWEKEAIKMEGILVNNYFKHLKEENIIF